MSTIRTYFWHDRIKGRWKLYRDRYLLAKPWSDFVYGNSGDIFTRDALAHFYPGTTPVNVAVGPRILCVGSIAHKMSAGDVLCGVGCKSAKLPETQTKEVHIHALRGPISYELFKTAGYDVSQVRFLADPGLLIASMVPDSAPTSGHVVFIPHYRERKSIRKKVPKGIHVLDIDNSPYRIARQIQRAECVYSSSLHGIIFAHALGRPCVFVRPATEEPLLKFEDYYLAVGLRPPKPLDSIADAKLASAPTSPAILCVDANQIIFPAADALKERGIIQ